MRVAGSLAGEAAVMAMVWMSMLVGRLIDGNAPSWRGSEEVYGVATLLHHKEAAMMWTATAPSWRGSGDEVDVNARPAMDGNAPSWRGSDGVGGNAPS